MPLNSPSARHSPRAPVWIQMMRKMLVADVELRNKKTGGHSPSLGIRKEANVKGLLWSPGLGYKIDTEHCFYFCLCIETEPGKGETGGGGGKEKIKCSFDSGISCFLRKASLLFIPALSLSGEIHPHLISYSKLNSVNVPEYSCQKHSE